jgi:hypothetical protein
VNCIQYRISVYAGRWDTRDYGRSWGKCLCAAVREAVARDGALWDVDFIGTAPNKAGLAVTVVVLVNWWRGGRDSFAARLHERLVVRLKPEFESQIAVEIMDDADTEDTLLDI